MCIRDRFERLSKEGRVTREDLEAWQRRVAEFHAVTRGLQERIAQLEGTNPPLDHDQGADSIPDREKYNLENQTQGEDKEHTAFMERAYEGFIKETRARLDLHKRMIAVLREDLAKGDPDGSKRRQYDNYVS